MSEEKKENNLNEEEKDKSEKVIYILTGLLVFVIFGAIAVLYFNPSTEEKIYKPEKIQVVAEKNKNHITQNNNITQESNLKKEEKKVVESINKTAEEKTNLVNSVPSKELEKKQDNKGEVNKATISNNKNENLNEAQSQAKKQDIKENQQISKAKEQETNEKKEKAIEKNKSIAKSEANTKETVKKEVKKEVKKQTVVKTVKKENKKVERKYYYIQVSAIASLEKANQLKNRLERRGFKRVIIIKEKGLYKVLIGRFTSMKEAFKFIREHNIKGGWVRIIKEKE